MAKSYVLKTSAGNLKITEGEKLGGNLWKWTDGEVKTFTITAPIRKGAPMAKAGFTTSPDIIDVTDLVDGLPKRILAGKVLVSTLTEGFPNDSYVGKSFSAVQGPPPEGKRYKAMTVHLLEVEPATETKSKK